MMRTVDVARLAAGAVAVVWPAPVVGLAQGHREAVSRATRLLGARWVVQALLSDRLAGSRAGELGAGVDVAHALSMVVAARRWPDAARPALLSAALAVTFAAADAADRPR